MTPNKLVGQTVRRTDRLNDIDERQFTDGFYTAGLFAGYVDHHYYQIIDMGNCMDRQTDGQMACFLGLKMFGNGTYQKHLKPLQVKCIFGLEI